MNKQTVKTQELKLSGESLISRIKELIHQGNVRRIIIKGEEDNTLVEIPLTVGVVGALLLPVWAAIGAIAALAANLTIVVELHDTDPVVQQETAVPKAYDDLPEVNYDVPPEAKLDSPRTVVPSV